MPDLVRVPVLDTHGLAAWAAGTRQPDGTVVPPKDRRGRLNAKHVELTAPDGRPPEPMPDLSAADLAWVLAADSRAWPTVEARWHGRALDTALALVRAGVVALRVSVAETAADVGAPSRWRLTPAWADEAARRRDRAGQGKDELRAAARALAEQVADVDNGLAAALAAAGGHERTLPVLVAAARDLLAGASHDGPRAFSQTHFGDTKARDDAPAILAAAGTAPATLAALGLVRSPYLGLGGSVAVETGDGTVVDLRHLPGPVQFRAVAGSTNLRAQVVPADNTVTLAVVENLQAAETACDAHGQRSAVAWCAGQPADAALALIAGLAGQAALVLVAPDADLGGVRIAARILSALPPGPPARILDAGSAPHEPRDRFARATLDQLAALADSADDDRVRDFAAAVLARGYPVEQEASARAVLANALRPTQG